MGIIQLLHGTDHIIEVPDIHIGNPYNDYGMGFYCTRVDLPPAQACRDYKTYTQFPHSSCTPQSD